MSKKQDKKLMNRQVAKLSLPVSSVHESPPQSNRKTIHTALRTNKQKVVARKQVGKTRHGLPKKHSTTLSLFNYTFTLQVKKKQVKQKNKVTTNKQDRRRRFQKAFSIVLMSFGLVGSVFFGARVLSSNSISAPPVTQPAVTSVLVDSTNKSLPASTSRRIQIADVNIDAEVVSVGKSNDGSIEVPSNPALVGQYQYAPTPGEIGPAVMVGHVDSIIGPAVFWRLRELQPGSKIIIQRADGNAARFIVTRIEEYSQNNFPTEKVYGNIDYAGLRLITCSGSFDLLSRHYSHNQVVYAVYDP